MNIFDNAVDLTDVNPSEWKKYIGNGYRSCFFTTNPDREGVIVLAGYDTNGNPQTFLCPHKPHLKYCVKYKTTEKDIFGRFVETRYFKNSKDRSKYVEACNGSLKIIENLRPEAEFLHSMFDDVALDPGFNTQKLRIHYLDIETEISDQFEKPLTARNRINMLTIYDTKTEKYYTWSLSHAKVDFKEDPLNNMDPNMFVFYEFYDNEPRMLSHFLNWFEENYPDVICGYNSQAYDLPYIVNRIERVLGNPDNVDMDTGKLSNVTKRLSPVGRVRVRKNDTTNERANKQAEILVDIVGIFSADELILYRDKFKIKQALDGGYGLDNVGEAEDCGHKIHYEGSLKDLYEKDYQKFYEYNVRDVDLLRRVEEKCRLIPLARMITSAGLSDYNTIYSSISYLIGSLCMFSKTQMHTVFTSYAKGKKNNESYEGAWVFPPMPGVYRGGIATVDFNSLYPSSIRAMNLSPETYVGKISRHPIPEDMAGFKNEPPIVLSECQDERFYMLPANGGRQMKISRAELDRLLNEKCIFTRNNTLFMKHSVKQGVVSAWCRHFYGLRKSTKKQMHKLDLDLYNKVVPEDKISETKKEVEILDARQQAIKIMINSIYGIIGTSFSPIYNIHMAQSITRSGKFCNISAANYIRKVFEERYGIDKNYVCQSSGDTDSVIGSTKIRIIRHMD